MRSGTPKLLHQICGRPMIAWPVAAARDAGASRIVVVDNPDRRLEAVLDSDVTLAIQEHPRGTADAARLAEHWRPYRAYALMHLWATLANP